MTTICCNHLINLMMLFQVQNADDNIYPQSVEPTLAFIFEESGIVVLNNEEGFSAKNIRALCDVGNSTKKGSNAGYIGKKGIGFKSVFRVCSGYHYVTFLFIIYQVTSISDHYLFSFGDLRLTSSSYIISHIN